MAPVRSCVCLILLIVHLQVTFTKPLFGFDWFCDMACDDEDITSTTAANAPVGLLDALFDCTDCPQRAQRQAQIIAVRLPQLPNGLNMNVTQNNGVTQFLLDAAQPMVPAVPAVPAAPAAPIAN